MARKRKQATRPGPGGVVEKRWNIYRSDGPDTIVWARWKTDVAREYGVPMAWITPAPPDWRNDDRGGVKDRTFKMRISSDELARLEARAEAAGLSKAAYVLDRCL